jgi:imidazole glycerol-phosphate synthase subunit HisH
MDIAVVDYGTGNLHSLVRALEDEGAVVHIEADLKRAVEADAVILPDGGSVKHVAAQLVPAAAALQSAVRAGKPCLGIGIGMELLFESCGDDPGGGLGMLEGHVRRLQARRLPHIGWNDVEFADDPIFRGMDRLVAYFASSHAAQPADESDVIGWTLYGQDRFPSAARRGCVWAVQFRPEKSGPAGSLVLRNFLGRIAA